MISKTYKVMNGLIQSVDTFLLLSVTSTSVSLSVTGVELVVPIATSLGEGLCIFSTIAVEYLKRKEQHNIRKQVLAGETLNNFCKLHSNCLEDIKLI